jgi:hypothetical protein
MITKMKFKKAIIFFEIGNLKREKWKYNFKIMKFNTLYILYLLLKFEFRFILQLMLTIIYALNRKKNGV